MVDRKGWAVAMEAARACWEADPTGTCWMEALRSREVGLSVDMRRCRREERLRRPSCWAEDVSRGRLAEVDGYSLAGVLDLLRAHCFHCIGCSLPGRFHSRLSVDPCRCCRLHRFHPSTCEVDLEIRKLSPKGRG